MRPSREGSMSLLAMRTPRICVCRSCSTWQERRMVSAAGPRRRGRKVRAATRQAYFEVAGSVRGDLGRAHARQLVLVASVTKAAVNIARLAGRGRRGRGNRGTPPGQVNQGATARQALQDVLAEKVSQRRSIMAPQTLVMLMQALAQKSRLACVEKLKVSMPSLGCGKEPSPGTRMGAPWAS